MEVLRDTDGSFIWNFTPDEDVQEIEPFRWEQLAEYFISRAKSYDSTGDFTFLENVNETGEFIGYWAMRHVELSVQKIQLPSIPVPVFTADIPQCTFPVESVPLPEPRVEHKFEASFPISA